MVYVYSVILDGPNSGEVLDKLTVETGPLSISSMAFLVDDILIV